VQLDHYASLMHKSLKTLLNLYAENLQVLWIMAPVSLPICKLCLTIRTSRNKHNFLGHKGCIYKGRRACCDSEMAG